MGLRPAKSHEKLDALGGACFSLPAGRQAGHAWFFDPVGRGVPPAKLHEKLRSARGIPRWSRWFFEPVVPRSTNTKTGGPRGYPGLSYYRWERSRTARSLNRLLPIPPECSCKAIPPSKDLGFGSVKSITVTPLMMQIM